MNVLVTGGAGFIGQNLVRRLLAEGNHVVIVDNLKCVTPDVFNWLGTDKRLDLRVVDIRDQKTLLDCMEGVEEVYHLAANADVPFSVKDPEYDFSTNIIGSKNVFEACLKHNIKRVIFTSSAAVYGIPTDSGAMSEETPLSPMSPYGGSKAAGEMLGISYWRAFGLPLRIVRLFNTMGPGQRHYVMVDWYRKLLASGGKSITILGDGTQVRDYVYVDDTVNALLLVNRSDKAVGLPVNVAGGNSITIRALAEKYVKILGLECEFNFSGESWKGDVPRLEGNITRLTGLGWKPFVSLEDGLSRLFDDLERRFGRIGG